MVPGRRPPLLSDVEYDAICRLVYEGTGLVFDEQKRGVVESRLRTCLRESSLTASDYIRRLRVDEDEWREFIDSLTVNDTHFYRDQFQMDVFVQVLEQLIADKLLLPYARLRIWSAACSIGCEPYTLAILVQEALQRQGTVMDWQILATDISPSCLRVAQAALYTDREVRDVPHSILSHYFRRNGQYWEFAHPCRTQVQFRYSNLLAPGTEVQGPFDIIFCRNVMIYFDDEARRRVADLLFDQLVPGGCVFLGASESMSRISRAFHLRRIGSGFLYVKP